MNTRRTIHRLLPYVPLLVGWAGFVGLIVWGAVVWRDPALRSWIVVNSALIPITCMMVGWWLMSPRTTPSLTGVLDPLARLVWTLGLISLVVHILIAFDVAHGWSHAAAVEHVRQVAGYGGGIVVNYLFAAVWLADVVWWWANPAGHATRPRWVRWAVHGFLAIVVVNATVVFGAPERRGIYVVLLTSTLLWWLCLRAALSRVLKWRGEANEPGRGPGSGDAPGSAAGHSPT